MALGRDPAANFTTVGKPPPPPESTISLRFSSPSLPEQSFCRLPFQHGLSKHGNREAGTTEKREAALTSAIYMTETECMVLIV